jgi:hypothetical protein
MPYVDIVTTLAILQFIVFGFRVGAARNRYGVKAPAITGHVTFERLFRVQQNTLESLIGLLPGQDPGKREVGYGLTFLPLVILIVGALIGAVRALWLTRGGG